MLKDLQYALRALRRSPGFSAAAVLSLALGLGANTALFSAVDAVLLRPLPYHEPDRIVLIYSTAKGYPAMPSSLPDMAAYRGQTRSFASVAGFDTMSRNLAVPGVEAERVMVERTTADFPKVLGVSPEAGRYFDAHEETFGSHRVVVVSHRLASRLAAKPGTALLLDGESFTIIGVMPASFSFDDPHVDAWVPISFPPNSKSLTRSDRSTYLVARLAPQATIETANADLARVAGALRQQFVENAGISAALVPVRESIAGDLRPTLLLLLGAVGLVLLIACANLANLLLARGAARSRELAVRAAMGATQSRLLRQLLTESVVLSLVGGALGIALAPSVLQGISRLGGAAMMAQLPPMQLDLRVLCFALIVSTLTGIGFGLLPALTLSHATPADVLKESAPALSPKSSRLRSVLVIAEVALSLLLLTGAALLLRTLRELQRVDPGYRADQVLTANISLPRALYGTREKQLAFMRDMLARARALPGVTEAGASSRVPIDDGGMGTYLWAQAHEPARLQDVPGGDLIVVSGGDFFRALGISLARGHFLDDPAQPEVVINETAARRLFSDEDPIGQRVSLDPPARLFPPRPGAAPYRTYTVAGVVHDVRSYGPAKPIGAQVWIRQEQFGERAPSMYLVLRGTVSASSVRELLHSFDSSLALYDVKTMEERSSDSVSGARLTAFLLSLFAGLALLLAMLGVYGVMAYSVEQRTREIGIRMALGAAASDVTWMVLRQGFVLVAAGIAIGLAGAVVSSRALAAVLFGVSATDPSTYVAMTAVQAAVALLALLLPAIRAARLQPAIALRRE